MPPPQLAQREQRANHDDIRQSGILVAVGFVAIVGIFCVAWHTGHDRQDARRSRLKPSEPNWKRQDVSATRLACCLILSRKSSRREGEAEAIVKEARAEASGLHSMPAINCARRSSVGPSGKRKDCPRRVEAMSEIPRGGRSGDGSRRKTNCRASRSTSRGETRGRQHQGSVGQIELACRDRPNRATSLRSSYLSGTPDECAGRAVAEATLRLGAHHQIFGLLFMGNIVTSRRFSSPAINITIR